MRCPGCFGSRVKLTARPARWVHRHHRGKKGKQPPNPRNARNPPAPPYKKRLPPNPRNPPKTRKRHFFVGFVATLFLKCAIPCIPRIPWRCFLPPWPTQSVLTILHPPGHPHKKMEPAERGPHFNKTRQRVLRIDHQIRITPWFHLPGTRTGRYENACCIYVHPDCKEYGVKRNVLVENDL